MIYMAKSTTILERAAVLLAILFASATAYLILLSADGIEKRLGRVGIKVLTRMMGLILASMAVQMVINGIKGAFGL